jgi:hypothetical protein
LQFIKILIRIKLMMIPQVQNQHSEDIPQILVIHVDVALIIPINATLTALRAFHIQLS